MMNQNQMQMLNSLGPQQQQQQQQQHHHHLDLSNGAVDSNGSSFPSLLRQGTSKQGMLNLGMNSGLEMNHNQNHHLQQQQHQQQQLNGVGNSSNMMALMSNPAATATQMGGVSGGTTSGMNNFSINDLKRLQQLQQQVQQANGGGGVGVGGLPNNALLNPSTHSQDSVLLQNLLDQKIQSSKFDDSLRNQLGIMGQVGHNPMMNQSLLQERLMFAPGFKGAGSEIQLPSPHSLFSRDGSRRMRGGVIEPFPEKLHRLLMEVEQAGRSDVISFIANGRAFAIHKPDQFFKEIVPLYFRQSRLSSFKRQLNLYGFELINTGPARGGYYHELFTKDQPDACRRMRRVAVKISTKKQKKSSED